LKMGIKRLLIALVILGLCGNVITQDCGTHTDCGTCTTHSELCGWCSATQTCHTGNASGPAIGHCIHSWEYQTCNECQKNTDCRSCQAFGDNCFWCGKGNYCSDPGPTCQGGRVDNCPCEMYATCGSCNTAGCNWCRDLGLCVEKHNSSCAPEIQCFCEDNLSCNTCMDDPVCGWCDTRATCEHKAGSACALTTSCEKSCSSFYHSCDVCTGVIGCAWCDKTKTCMSVNTEKELCMITEHCPTPKPERKFDGASFAGGFFLVVGLGLLGAGGVYIYRRRKATNSYQTL